MVTELLSSFCTAVNQYLCVSFLSIRSDRQTAFGVMPMKYKRVFLIVMDSFGIGQDPRASEFGDEGANTCLHIWQSQGGFCTPTLMNLGLGRLVGLPFDQNMGYALALQEASNGKDTMTGHWEMMGLVTKKPFQTFTNTGFPRALIDELEKRTNHKVIGNKAASGTAILDELGEEQLAEDALIVYTSADSVLQICGNEDKMGLDELYRCCRIAREITVKDEWKVGRVIARPYIGLRKGAFIRTANRRDYALKPDGLTVLDGLKANRLDVISIGKISDIFDGQGITRAVHSKSSAEGMKQTIECLHLDFKGLCFTNLVDFDAKWGHRRNPKGYKNELECFDSLLDTFITHMQRNDLLIISADHGNDPTFKGTDHTRERVPCFFYSPQMTRHAILPTEQSFGAIGWTIADNFDLQVPVHCIGDSLLNTFV